MPLPLSRSLSLRDGLAVGWAALRADPTVLGAGAAWLWVLHVGRGASLMPVPPGESRLGATIDAVNNPENLPAVLLFGLVQLAAFMLRTWVEPGFLRAQRDVVMAGRGKGLALVGGVDVFVPMLGVRVVNAAVLLVPALIPLLLLVAGLPTLLASVVLGVGVLAAAWVLIGLQFATRLVALGEYTAIPALRRSWDMCAEHRLQLFMYDAALVGFLLLVGYLPGSLIGAVVSPAAGLLVSAVAYTVARPIASTALTCAFLLNTRETALVYRLMEPIARRLQQGPAPTGRIPAPDEPITEEGSVPH